MQYFNKCFLTEIGISLLFIRLKSVKNRKIENVVPETSSYNFCGIFVCLLLSLTYRLIESLFAVKHFSIGYMARELYMNVMGNRPFYSLY